jgi:formate transporter
MESTISGEPYAPDQIARLVEKAGVRKATLPLVPLVVLGVLAGAFIAFGAMFFTLTVTGSNLGFGLTRLAGGIVFSLGLILVVIAGAELFTGNNLIVMAWADRKVTTIQLLRNWVIVYLANFVGAAATAVMVFWSGVLSLDDGAVAATAGAIAAGKVSLPFFEAFVRGVLCNALVCLAIWLAIGARRVTGKILAIVFPIAAFVALGFEHSIANMYFLPLGWLLDTPGVTGAATIANLVPVTLGNIVGGSVLVALVYWVCYLRPAKSGRP